MANETTTLIQKITVGAAGSSSITFSNIPQTYTDLKICTSIRSTRNGTFDTITIKFNNNLTNMSFISLEGRGNSAVSFSGSSASYLGSSNGSTSTASTFSNIDVYIPNYTSSTNKSYSVDSVAENNATSAYQNLVAGLWSDTAAVTSITLSPDNGSFVQYSTFYLYGIAKQGVTPAATSSPYATGGDDITFDGTYWIHTFKSTGTFTPKKALTCDYLVVAGGGGGGASTGGYASAQGGGGAGGLRSTVTATGGGGSLESALTCALNTSFTVTVGAGGAGGAATGESVNGNQGSNSVFSTVTSIGGGFGGGRGNSGGSGGSGGGTGGFTGNSTTGGSATSGQGYAGADSQDTGVASGAGGGGAGAAGDLGNGVGGNGGNGVATSISGTSTTYAGGGGGGAKEGSSSYTGGSGGTGGGGRGGNYVSATKNGVSGTTNTGGGGGGGSAFGGGGVTGGNGGSGIVIVRYPA